MAELRLQGGSKRVLADWWDSGRPREGDQQLVMELLRSIADGTWRRRWHPPEDLANNQPGLPVMAFRPRETLVVIVRFSPNGDSPIVKLINIFDTDDLSGQD